MLSEWVLTIGNNIFSTIKREDGTYKSTLVRSLPVEPSIIASPLKSEDSILGEFQSKSFPGQTYYVCFNPADGISCTCTGFRVHKHRWHVAEIARRLEEQVNAHVDD